ncbi:MAG: hypothetical protein DCO96_13430 [Fluviicola sp. XM-24bin1]|nr:MAG: hypothetical protein DCO96_13430 [Fluviicola sp. XM-24bin1]
MIELDLTINPSPVATISSNPDGSLSTSTFSGIIAWYDCDNDEIINGETSTTFIPSANGNYAVILTELGSQCSDTSDCFLVDYVSFIGADPFNQEISIEPNPTTGDFEIVVSSVYDALVFEIIDATGKVVQKVSADGNATTKVRLIGEPGIYMIRAITEFGWYMERIVKQ